MKNTKSYKSKFKAWFITLIVLLVAGSVSAAVICQTQIREVISIAQSEEKEDTKKLDNAVEEKKSGDNYNADIKKSEEDFEITKHITPLTTVRVIGLGVIVGTWVGMAIWYWLLVAFWMKNRTAMAGYNSTLWFIFTLFTNLIAVVIYELLLRIPVVCPHCFHINTRGDYCKHCGTQLKSTCPNCGQRLNKNSKYCPNCGNKM